MKHIYNFFHNSYDYRFVKEELITRGKSSNLEGNEKKKLKKREREINQNHRNLACRQRQFKRQDKTKMLYKNTCHRELMNMYF